MNRNWTAPDPEWKVEGRRRVLAAIRELYPDFEGIGTKGFVAIVDPELPVPQLQVVSLIWGGPWLLQCTRRALEIFDDRQLRAAVAHELSHAALGHYRNATFRERLVFAFQDAPWLMRVGLVAHWVDRTAAIVSARRARREMEADIGAVALTRDPQALVSALEAICKDRGFGDRQSREINPRGTTPARLLSLRPAPAHFRTYPRMEKRVEVIQRAGRHMDQLNIPDLSRPLNLHPKAPRPRAMGSHDLGV